MLKKGEIYDKLIICKEIGFYFYDIIEFVTQVHTDLFNASATQFIV